MSAGGTVLQSQRLGQRAAGKSPPIQRKTLVGSPFELGVRVISAIVAKEREWLWVEER
ncbi:hypothetical protein [Paenibacillus eucommiae]|uniref:Uncharacterized protein n=1 Tax=Paenibacillus eucommiae TaxID=1355755 RepID=A0ABS4J637_9BACL|nr:hypothetical protein [Paenibacillus eucommiae]MBP1995248.1 hypothetical protein [Paenibacillus eucommiae]